MKASTPKRLVSTAQAAGILDVSPNTIRNYVADGKLAAYRSGRLLKFDPVEVRALLFKVDNGNV